MSNRIKVNEPSNEVIIDRHDAEEIERGRDRMAAFDEAVKPLIEFVNKCCTPHDIVVVQQGSAEMYSGQMAIPFPYPA